MELRPDAGRPRERWSAELFAFETMGPLADLAEADGMTKLSSPTRTVVVFLNGLMIFRHECLHYPDRRALRESHLR